VGLQQSKASYWKVLDLEFSWRILPHTDTYKNQRDKEGKTTKTKNENRKGQRKEQNEGSV